METGQEEVNGDQGKSNILTEDIPKYGRVSLLFYIPETVKDRDTMVQLIRENGGNIVNFHECFTYQVGTPGNTNEQDYYPGTVYSFQWIVESIEAKQLQEKSKYILAIFQGGREFPFNKKKIQYTIREIIVIYNWISGRKSQSSRKTWESLGNDGVLYCRSRESLKNFWKKWRKSSLEECIDQMLDKDTRYCHNYAEVVHPHEPIVDDKKVKPKRPREKVEQNGDEDEEVIGEGEGDDHPLQSKQFLKRKIKKKPAEDSNRSDRVKTTEHKTQKIEEIKEVEDDVEEEAEAEAEAEVEAEGDDEMEDSKKEAQKAKKPDEPLDPGSQDGDIEGSCSKASSDLGFPSLEAASDDGGDN